MNYTRRILRLTGKDTLSFLQGITTQDVNALDKFSLIFTAFLSPQGKLLFDGFLSRDGDALLLDIATEHEEGLTTFLKRYKLRADVTITPTDLLLILGEGYPDPRHPELPKRTYTTHHSSLTIHYHTQRISLSIPEAAYDLLNAISFTKGCYVGQEVTARMHYKNIARRGIFHVKTQSGALPAPFTPILAGEQKLGELRSSHDSQGLALLRFDAYEKALSESLLITADSVPLTLSAPSWAAPKFEQFRQAKDGL